VTDTSIERRDSVREICGSTRLQRAAAVLSAAFLLMWPALVNRYPLFYPDSMTYLADGGRVARALFLHQRSVYYGMRSFIYSLVILPFHWYRSPWLVIALQALLTAYVIWLVARSLIPERVAHSYLLLVALLSFLTSLSWYVSLLMPDILGPVLYLCIYLLVFAPDALSRAEHRIVVLIALWSMASHATHLMLAVGMIFLLAVLSAIFRPGFMRGRQNAIGELATIVIVVAASQLLLNTYLYGKPSLNGERPPFLTARLIADGPGRWYLEQHCGTNASFTLCSRVKDLPSDSDEFIWNPDGIWETTPIAAQDQILREEIPFALATLRAYPRAQISKSAENFYEQLTSFEIGFDTNEWMLTQFDRVFPRGKERYLESGQGIGDLPFNFFSAVIEWTVLVSLALIVTFGVLLWPHREPRLVGLIVVIIPAVIANAFVTGVLSTVEDRYQSRVVWLLPFLGISLAFAWLAHRQRLHAARSASRSKREMAPASVEQREPSPV